MSGRATEHGGARRGIGAVTLALALGLSASVGLACSVPVFRYALERWPPSPYELVVFHRGPLDPATEALLQRLDPFATNHVPANVRPHTVDLDGRPPADRLALREQHPSPTLPAAVLRYPRGAPAQGTLWAGPLNETNLLQLLDSPFRQRLVQRLARGDTAAWVLLESGDPRQDDAAARLLQARLDHLQKTLQIAKLEPSDIANRVMSIPEHELKVAFSFLRLSRADPAEALFVRMLLGTEEDLANFKDPVAFPVYGRGRALFALIGEGINAETIDEAGEFLVAPCSCIVKEENPGLDLLLAADWDSLVRVSATDEPPPELTSVASFGSESAPTIRGSTNAGAPPAAVPLAVATPEAAVPVTTVRLAPGLWVLAVAGVLVLVGGMILLLRGKGER
jgi:hypothetical protein